MLPAKHMEIGVLKALSERHHHANVRNALGGGGRMAPHGDPECACAFYIVNKRSRHLCLRLNLHLHLHLHRGRG